MTIVYSKTSIGYSHLKADKPCQDFSATYRDEERVIVTACDGHGGSVYIRSGLGSKFASDAVIRVFSGIDPGILRRYSEQEVALKLRLQILCEWNAMVERSVEEEPIRKKEIRHLTENASLQLKTNSAKAYGTTLNGAMLIGQKLILASLGDGGVFLIKGKNIVPAFEAEDEDTVANITHSMCEEDAFNYLKTGIFDIVDLDGVILCTDGLINPYRSEENFNRSFVQPTVALARGGKVEEIGEFVERLATRLGIGDDVSLGLILIEK